MLSRTFTITSSTWIRPIRSQRLANEGFQFSTASANPLSTRF